VETIIRAHRSIIQYDVCQSESGCQFNAAKACFSAYSAVSRVDA
jgi:hypothetical protein